MTAKIIKHFEDLISQYDAYIFSVRGVFYEDEIVYEDAIQVIKNLSNLRKSVGMLSNARERSEEMMKFLESIGITPPHYQALMTAGEATYQHLSRQNDIRHAVLGKKCYFLGPQNGVRFLKDLNVNRTDLIEEASFILVYGSDGIHAKASDYRSILEQGLRHHIPMICISREPVSDGLEATALNPAKIGEAYEKMGGTVFVHGKPNASLFLKTSKDMNVADIKRVLVVGDSLNADIAGAKAAHMKSMLILSHLTRAELKLRQKNPSLEEIRDMAHEKGYNPLYIMSHLTW
ncbi:TIGR01459 family HAD-type hydrolase [Candidatus Nucleicultrix amoebiphila]|jgi:HAD superfamily hydrolase (TIGR01459 family)|uniref:Uncharacterized protein n=1 Tax=Candidatus Nucleicultrix amoebiphila FS5 TaxID=1414854 RepID=A0A1W6N3E8_9PROT|nr:TIGR01459 family HAD-type hydrolase [Candidatus Nucleicultrix amoebiphila]ARN84375.1 hypothetical protein GQ61_02455 [Candidatus Nucleicultrix amoebiphila FS5]